MEVRKRASVWQDGNWSDSIQMAVVEDEVNALIGSEAYPPPTIDTHLVSGLSKKAK